MPVLLKPLTPFCRQSKTIRSQSRDADSLSIISVLWLQAEDFLWEKLITSPLWVSPLEINTKNCDYPSYESQYTLKDSDTNRHQTKFTFEENGVWSSSLFETHHSSSKINIFDLLSLYGLYRTFELCWDSPTFLITEQLTTENNMFVLVCENANCTKNMVCVFTKWHAVTCLLRKVCVTSWKRKTIARCVFLRTKVCVTLWKRFILCSQCIVYGELT